FVGRLFCTGGLESEADPPLQLLLKAFGGPAVLEEEELEPRLLAVVAEHVAVAEDFRDPANDGEHLIPSHEGAEPHGQMRGGGEPAADTEGEADLAALRVAHGRHPDVVDLRIRAPRPAPRHPHLV